MLMRMVERRGTGSRWSKKQLKYFVEHGADLPHSTQDSVFEKALKFWSDVSGLSFSKASNAREADPPKDQVSTELRNSNCLFL